MFAKKIQIKSVKQFGAKLILLRLRPCLASGFLTEYTCIIQAQLITRKYTLGPFGSPVSNRGSPSKHVQTRRVRQLFRRETGRAFFTRPFLDASWVTRRESGVHPKHGG
jgi:hypothetical protein